MIAALSLVTAATGCGHTPDTTKATPEHTRHAFDYSLGTVPAPVTTVHYTITITTPASTDDVYYAQQFNGAGSDLGPDPATKTQRVAFYSGIQPHPNGTANLLFSYFGAGATPASPNCRSGADGGQGVHCDTVDQHYAPGTAYTFDITRADGLHGPVYAGFATNQKTGERSEIGAWSPPANVTGFGPKAGGFAENFHRVACIGVPPVDADYRDVTVNNQPITVAHTHRTLNPRPTNGSACAPTSEGFVTPTGAGSYTVHTTEPAQ